MSREGDTPQAMTAPNLHFQMDPASGVPIYRQLMDQIQYYVASGVLAPGDQLPSIRTMARQLAVNATTVIKTYSDLEQLGVLERRQGKGVFVSEAPAEIKRPRIETSLLHTARELAVAARQMGLTDREVLELVEQELNQLSSGDRRKGESANVSHGRTAMPSPREKAHE